MEWRCRKCANSWPSTSASSASSWKRSRAPVQTIIIPFGAMEALNQGCSTM